MDDKQVTKTVGILGLVNGVYLLYKNIKEFFTKKKKCSQCGKKFSELATKLRCKDCLEKTHRAWWQNRDEAEEIKNECL
jgi:rRNA maturation endonuclease Nob1